MPPAYDDDPREPAAPRIGDADFLQLALGTLKDVLLVTDAQLDDTGPRILFVAGDVAGLTGYRPHELIGRTPRIFQGPGTQCAARARLRAALAAGAPAREEILNYRRDGSEYWIELVVTPVRDAAGRVTHFVSVQRDISERRRMRRAILESAERERDGIARDLHDVLGQELVGISLLLAAIPAPALEPPSTRLALRDTREKLGEVIAQTRALAHGLAPIRLGAGGLPDALRVLARAMSNAYHVSIRVQASRRLALTLSAEELSAVYRIAQEAMLNAVRHGAPHRITLRLKGDGEALTMQVEDDGSGFDPGLPYEGLGLDSMRYRARELGGTLELSTLRGRGTRISLRLGARR